MSATHHSCERRWLAIVLLLISCIGGCKRSLQERLGSSNSVERTAAVAELAHSKDTRKALRTLAKIVRDDPDYWVRAKAIETLGLLPDPGASQLLLEKLSDTTATTPHEDQLRHAAISALETRKDPAIVPALVEFVRAPPDRTIEFGAAHILEKLGQPAVEPLVALLRDPSWIVQGNARRVLEDIADNTPLDRATREKFVPLLHDTNPAVQSIARRVLGVPGQELHPPPQ